LQVSYTIPTTVLKGSFIKRVKIFANAQNLLTFSPMKDYDPETNLKKESWYGYPSVKTFSAGINVTF